jgi:hypothetical protein
MAADSQLDPFFVGVEQIFPPRRAALEIARKKRCGSVQLRRSTGPSAEIDR